MKLRSFAARKDTDMTAGSIPRHLLLFALPLFAGNVFQQLYNTVDSVIVGNYVGKEALAAIGCTASIINTFISFFSGLSSGAGVIISNYYGAKDRKNLRLSVHTFLFLTIVLCAVITSLGVLFTPALLKMMKTPADVFQEGVVYLRIYFYGVSGLLLYNTGAGILRAVGDSSRPLYVLIFCALTNTVLDVFFVKTLGWGVAGAAWATIIAQALSAAIVLAMLTASESDYRLSMHELKPSRGVLGAITSIGMPSAIQMAVTAFSNVFVQSYVNRFGSSYMAGWAAYEKIDSFAMQPMNSLSLAMTTFVGQNFGAGKVDRVRSGPRYGLLIGFVIMILLIPPLIVFAPQLVSLFNREAEVIQFGTYFIRTISLFYFALCINQVFSGMLRGGGDTVPTMIIMLFSFVAFRQVYLFTVYRLGLGIRAITLGYPVGWMMCSTLLLIYYYTRGRKRTSIHG